MFESQDDFPKKEGQKAENFPLDSRDVCTNPTAESASGEFKCSGKGRDEAFGGGFALLNQSIFDADAFSIA